MSRSYWSWSLRARVVGELGSRRALVVRDEAWTAAARPQGRVEASTAPRRAISSSKSIRAWLRPSSSTHMRNERVSNRRENLSSAPTGSSMSRTVRARAASSSTVMSRLPRRTPRQRATRRLHASLPSVAVHCHMGSPSPRRIASCCAVVILPSSSARRSGSCHGSFGVEGIGRVVRHGPHQMPGRLRYARPRLEECRADAHLPGASARVPPVIDWIMAVGCGVPVDGGEPRVAVLAT